MHIVYPAHPRFHPTLTVAFALPLPSSPAHRLTSPVLQKLVARKARKFTAQNGRLLVPALELAYFFSALAHSPAATLYARMLPVADDALAAAQGGTDVVWDDVCLALFLRAVVLRYIAFPVRARALRCVVRADARAGPRRAAGRGGGGGGAV